MGYHFCGPSSADETIHVCYVSPVHVDEKTVQGARSVETTQVKDSPQICRIFSINFGFQGPVAFAMLLGGEQPFMAFGSRKELLDGHHHRKLHVQLGLFAPNSITLHGAFQKEAFLSTGNTYIQVLPAVLRYLWPVPGIRCRWVSPCGPWPWVSMSLTRKRVNHF